MFQGTRYAELLGMILASAEERYGIQAKLQAKAGAAAAAAAGARA
ncbi:MAG: hypothetical protein R3D67_20320 [Hyphomicrobiaceae bacterium]